MEYELVWDGGLGFQARFTDWLTPESAARLAHQLASDPRFDSVLYGVVDVLDCPGHGFRRDDAIQVALATGEILGALIVNPRVLQVAICTDPQMLRLLDTYTHLIHRPVQVFSTLAEANYWLAMQSPALKHLACGLHGGGSRGTRG